MAARVNLQAATREELTELVRKQAAKIKDLKEQLAAAAGAGAATDTATHGGGEIGRAHV